MACNNTAEILKPNLLHHYKHNTCVPFEEDATHEFKGHTDLCQEELPPWTQIPDTSKRTRDRISKSLNAFLNSGQEATVFLGISDEGQVIGIPLTASRMDHIRCSLHDLFSRYNPPVERHRYSIEFVPVVEEDATEEEIWKTVNFDPCNEVNECHRNEKHNIRTYKECWCRMDLKAQLQNGILPPLYVVEIHIASWDPNNENNVNSVGQMKAQPYHEDECRKVYIRLQSSCCELNPSDLYSMVRQNVGMHYTKLIERLSEELRLLMSQQKELKYTP